MDNRKYILSQTLTVLFGELILSALMIGVFAVLGYFDSSVVLGAAAGSVIATLNHLVLILGVMAASAKAEKQDVKGGQMLVQMSYMGRLIGLFLILVLCAKSGIFNLIALVIPLIFTRPVLTISEYFNKKGGNEA
ncbi:MAG: ATP synthase subunit I [Oscillospiraceae bacterium]|nr:ATP synthase subunit I [Oscillospiraceae bacterium]